jgi:hypothetical protein
MFFNVSGKMQKIFGSTPKVVENPQKGLGTANFNFPAIRYIIQA